MTEKMIESRDNKMIKKSEWYIGAPNGVVICVDHVASGQLVGNLYEKYSSTPIIFTSCDELIFKMEQFFDELQFPYATTTNRSFADSDTYIKKESNEMKQERKKIMTDDELLSKHGDLGTFVIRVQHRQNSSWQGRITWMEENKTLCFRSIWEMIKLMEGAVNKAAGPVEDAEQEVSWFEDEDAIENE
jgi:hypothetical protein